MSLSYNQVCVFDSTEPGAPVLNNAVGTMLDVLRSCLVTGFHTMSVSSITVTSGVAVATSASHGFVATLGRLVEVVGASVPALNGAKQPSAVTTNTFTYPAPGVADGTYTGSISARRPPLGWTELYTGATSGIFQRTSAEATAMLLRVTDSIPDHARMQILESASDASTYVVAAPAISGGYYWSKGALNSTAKPWVLVGTQRGFYLFNPTTQPQPTPHWFVDINSIYPSDPYACLGSGASDTGFSYEPNDAAKLHLFTTALISNAKASIARGNTGVSGSVLAGLLGPFDSLQVMGSEKSAPPAGARIPVFTDVPVGEASVGGIVIRGSMAGLAYPGARAPYSHLEVVTPAGSARSYVAINVSEQKVSGSARGQVLIDVTGPWYE